MCHNSEPLHFKSDLRKYRHFNCGHQISFQYYQQFCISSVLETKPRHDEILEYFFLSQFLNWYSYSMKKGYFIQMKIISFFFLVFQRFYQMISFSNEKNIYNFNLIPKNFNVFHMKLLNAKKLKQSLLFLLFINIFFFSNPINDENHFNHNNDEYSNLLSIKNINYKGHSGFLEHIYNKFSYPKIFYASAKKTEKKCYYDILNVTKKATHEEISKSFKKLTLLYHPDKNRSPDASEKFVQINEAYQVLGSPDKRSMYDRYGHEGMNNNDAFDFEESFDIFSPFMRSAKKAPDTVIKVPIPLKILFTGATYSIYYRHLSTCPNHLKCLTDDVKCHQRGISVTVQRFHNYYIQNQVNDPLCFSRNKRWMKNCKHCPSGPEELMGEEITATINPGTHSNQILRFPRFGDEIDGLIPADLVLEIEEISDPRFSREGNDLRFTMDINIGEALLGFKKFIIGIDDAKIPIIREDVTDYKYVHVVRGEGMRIPGKSDIHRGDLLVNFNIIFPTDLDNDQKEFIKSAFKNPR